MNDVANNMVVSFTNATHNTPIPPCSPNPPVSNAAGVGIQIYAYRIN